MGYRPTFLTPEALAKWIPELRRQHKMYVFYKTPEWVKLRGDILEAAHYECEDCKKKSPAVITRATCVHHEREVERWPELALSTFYIDEHGQKKQQLHALCARCHNDRHDRSFKGATKPEPLTPERW